MEPTVEITEHQRLQNTFNAIWAHSQTMTHQSVAPSGGCAYRAPDGSKCFFGALIPDALYEPEMEARGASYVMESFSEVGNFFKKTGFACAAGPIRQLQVIHDGHFDERNERLIEFAQEHNLTVPA